jgi:hypothetical protein
VIGITGTPVIDRTRGPHGAVYVVAMSMNGSGNYYHRLHALDLATGAELFGGPTDIQATYPGTGDGSSGGYVIFDAGQYAARPALLELNGTIYISFGSHCDSEPYTGWIMGYSAATLAQTTVLDVTPNGGQGGIWMSGAGPAVDSSGNIYVLVANGSFDTTLDSNGFPSYGDYGNAFLKMSSGKLAVADYFDMDNEQSESGTDTDLGSGGALVLPDMTDSSNTVRQLAVGAGKDGNLYVVDRNNMGKYNSAANQIYQQLSGVLNGGIWSAPAYFNGLLYYGPVGSPIFAFQFNKALLSAAPVAQTNNSFGYPGATPAISANATSNPIVWAAENVSPAVLHAYDAATLVEIYNSNQASGSRDQFGNGNKFVTPTIAHGKVYVGTTTGVGVFGLLYGPSIVSLSPSSGAGQSAVLTAVLSDPNGATALSEVFLLVNKSLTGANSCEVHFLPRTNQLWLLNDAGTAWLTPVLTPGGSGSVANSQCTLYAGSSTVSTAGNDMTFKVSLTFAGTQVGSQNVYLYAADVAKMGVGWTISGTWTPVSAAPVAVQSLTPNSGTGRSVVFAAVLADPNGAADLNEVFLLVNTSVKSANGCEVHYLPRTNQLTLLNDAGTAWLTPVLTPGGSGSVANSQCTLNAAYSAVSSSGNDMTLKVSLAFAASQTGSHNVYLNASGVGAAGSGWVEKGTWTP